MAELSTLIPYVDRVKPYRQYGRVTEAVGLMIESEGPPASVGELCSIFTAGGREILAEVVGFKGNKVLLMPYDRVEAISPGSLVQSWNKPLEVPVGMSMIGTVVDSLGRPFEGGIELAGCRWFSTDNDPPNPMSRPRIQEPLQVGLKVVDGLFTIGKGQRIGIFAGSGVGKSTMMASISKQSDADINVIALIGERGREVRDFIERDLGPEGMKNTVVVVATSDQPALMRIKGAYTATAAAEYFRAQGKNVNLMMDSVTRVAMAQREVGLAIGEPPTTKGYTPSVFAMLPRLLERSGTSEHGTITAFYTVLVDGDDMNEPVADTVRGILDGHLVLDRKLANKGHFPAVNVLQSVSRLMTELVPAEHVKAADHLRSLLAVYQEQEDLINIGAYKKGSNPQVDEAVRRRQEVNEFLMQHAGETVSFSETQNQLIQSFGTESR
ncbi:flagellar protein export ATPase FliI [Alkalicoccus urumqiensis]|uniref:Flagellar protein export ATPase FliI n=1 Tax=Alkalicoccus urumqiensis TaxID=1548213 RepID=A0A2P6MG67_ALKUR|nr:flagellar protein export ATPase FliI [Alkalicoccus urumqiensis]PRO65230.1 flagellar protein export ATPase FliI [Alkalicoccus urumqiensis]